MAQLAVKRFLDVAVCSVLLVVLLPFLVIIALVVRFSSPGPAFYAQERVGRNGRTYRMFKFRTMTGRPNLGLTAWSQAEEARVTRVGRFLRAYGLDELPQLVNIIRGDMSIIGPRPPLPAQVESFGDRDRRMLLMRPGVTSLAAVRGRYSLTPEQRRELHVEYVDRWSPGLDLRILLRTIAVVLGRRNAAEPQARPEGNTATHVRTQDRH
jgi:lipopolysaccharide/colanic/teichoic acid biosynthesis glycosyltransferase